MRIVIVSKHQFQELWQSLAPDRREVISKLPIANFYLRPLDCVVVLKSSVEVVDLSGSGAPITISVIAKSFTPHQQGGLS